MRGRGRGSWRASAAAGAGWLLVVVLAAGCAFLSDGAPSFGPGLTSRWLQLSHLSDRRALVVSPTSVRPNRSGQRRVPLVVVLHGLDSDPELIARQSGWPDAARQHGLVAVFGEGLDKSWNAGSCCGQSAADHVDDVAYLQRVIEDVERMFPIDRDRVFMVGHSNGGMMTYRFLCSHAGELAGAASVAGTDTDDCSPSAPVPFLQISGGDDEIVPLAGGQSVAPVVGKLPSVTGSVDRVASSMGCPAPVVLRARPISATRWSPCREGVTVGLDVIGGAGHDYPSTATYSATPRILEFWGVP